MTLEPAYVFLCLIHSRVERLFPPLCHSSAAKGEVPSDVLTLPKCRGHHSGADFDVSFCIESSKFFTNAIRKMPLATIADGLCVVIRQLGEVPALCSPVIPIHLISITGYQK